MGPLMSLALRAGLEMAAKRCGGHIGNALGIRIGSHIVPQYDAPLPDDDKTETDDEALPDEDDDDDLTGSLHMAGRSVVLRGRAYLEALRTR